MSHYISKKRIRYSFGQIPSASSIPNLITIQKKSYEDFLQLNSDDNSRKNEGLENVLRSICNIKDPEGKISLTYLSYKMCPPKYHPAECVRKGITYSRLLKVTFELFLREENSHKKQEVVFCEVPLMTDRGVFIINGTQRIIVSQLHRSPGVFYDCVTSKLTGLCMYSAKVIPYYGSWIDFELRKNRLYFRIDNRKKIPCEIFFKALGLNNLDIATIFYDVIHVEIKNGALIAPLDINDIKKGIIRYDILDKKRFYILRRESNELSSIINSIILYPNNYCYIIYDTYVHGSYVLNNVLDNNNDIVLKSGSIINSKNLSKLKISKNKKVVLLVDQTRFIRNIVNTRNEISKEDALLDIQESLRPEEPSSVESAETFFQNMFFNDSYYNLSIIGRMKINYKLNLNVNHDVTHLTFYDIVEIIKYLGVLFFKNDAIDDINSLINRRVRSVGELIENQFRLGMFRMRKVILERMSSIETEENFSPFDLINTKPLVSTLKDF